MEIPFIGGAYLGRSSNLDSQRCKNLYPEVDKQGGRALTLANTPGLSPKHTLGDPFSNTYNLGNGADDGHVLVDNTSFNNSDSGVYCGYRLFGSYYTYHCFFRYPAININPGSTIISAIITFNSGISMGYTNEITTRWYCNDVDDAVAPTSYAEFVALIKTTAYVDWVDDTNWQDNQAYDSPDFKTIVQEVVDRPGWTSGNALMVMGYYQSRVGAYRHMVIDSYDSGKHDSSFVISGF